MQYQFNCLLDCTMQPKSMLFSRCYYSGLSGRLSNMCEYNKDNTTLQRPTAQCAVLDRNWVCCHWCMLLDWRSLFYGELKFHFEFCRSWKLFWRWGICYDFSLEYILVKH